MTDVVAFFEHVPTWFRTALLVGGIVLFWFLEGFFPLFKRPYRKFRHGFLNLFFTLTTAVVGFGMAGLLLFSSNYVQAHRFGILFLFDMPLWLEVLTGVLLLDLIGAYFIHWTEHKVKWMWKFHVVHHSDTMIDVTSGLRHHPGETFFRMSLTILAVFVVGAPMGVVMIYQSLSVFFAHLTHANINLPQGLDRTLSLIFVTPHMHKVHHHFRQPYTDTNYGNIFSLWDRIFGSFSQIGDSLKLTYGINTHPLPAEYDSLANLLTIPFQPYREPDRIQEGAL